MIWGMIFHKNLNEWVIIGNYFWIRSLTKQIKRTRLRLVAYIQVLSRVSYLPNRYGAHFKLPPFLDQDLLIIVKQKN